jgi:hypothetical protein
MILFGAEDRGSSFIQSVQSDSGTHPVSVLEDTADNLPRCKATG